MKNGIYGEMFVAAMLAEAVQDTLAWCRESSDWELVWDRIHGNYGHYHAVHTINNAALVVMGLVFGAEDYERGIVVTVRSGWDTDCNGATVSSILGAKFGVDGLPDKWIGVLSDRLMSCVRDCNDNRISELAERTHRLATQMLSPPEEDGAAELLAESAAAKLPGIWALDLQLGKPVLTVNADLSGQIEFKAFGEVSKIRDVRLDGTKLRFVFATYKGDSEVDVAFEGTLTGDRLVGECTSGGYEFAATGTRI